jgi:hypothetical protein
MTLNVLLMSDAACEGPVKKSMVPFIIQEETVSPGCTLAERMMVFFLSVTIDLCALLAGAGAVMMSL